MDSGIWVSLNGDVSARACIEAGQRMLSFSRNSDPNTRKGSHADILAKAYSAFAEAAVAQYFGLDWTALEDPTGFYDVGDCIDVKSIVNPNYQLAVSEKTVTERPATAMVLAYVTPTLNVNLVGWIPAQFASKLVLPDRVYGRRMYFVPQRHLMPISDLADLLTD